MALPYFPMFPTDFEAKTSHLTLAEDGAYNRLLRLMWMTSGCTLPADNSWIMRRMRVDQEEFDTVVSVVISEFFTVENGRLSNAKLGRIFTETNEAHQKRVLAGSKGGKAKSLKANSSASSNAKAMPKQPEPEPELYKEEPKGSLSPSVPKKPSPTGTRISEDWVLSKHLGEWAMDEGATREMVQSQAEQFKDYWIGVAGAKARKADWDATWRNWIRKAITDTKPKFKSISGGRDERRNQGSAINNEIAARFANGTFKHDPFQ